MIIPDKFMNFAGDTADADVIMHSSLDREDALKIKLQALENENAIQRQVRSQVFQKSLPMPILPRDEELEFLKQADSDSVQALID